MRNNPRMGMAVITCLGLLFALVTIEPWLLQHFAQPRWAAWSVQHVMLPLARSACVLAFILLGYPAIFGLSEAPPLAAVLQTDERWSHLLNLGFAASMLLPLLPTLERVPGAVLPLQGFLLLALLFRWISPGAAVSLWPSTDAWAALALAALAPAIARFCLPDAIAHHEQRRDALLIPLQLPPLMLYGQALGTQLTA